VLVLEESIGPDYEHEHEHENRAERHCLVRFSFG
jgi:hypothetical protein